MTPKEIKRKDYTVQIGYSRKAIKNRLLKFISKSGDSFEISAEEMSDMLIGGVNSDTLAATFVQTDRINVVEVGRQLQCVLDKDMKKGEKININYTHPYPVDFAVIEQAYGIAKIQMDVPLKILTKKYINNIKAKIKPEQETFLQKFYSGFKNLNLNKKKN